MIKIIISDLIDFLIVTSLGLAMTFICYFSSAAFIKMPLSFYFPEQFIEIFFINPSLLVVLLASVLIINIIYNLVRRRSFAIYRGFLSFIGVLCFFISPLYAWWIDPRHRGLADLILSK